MQKSNQRIFPVLFTWTVVDLAAAGMVGLCWYVLFDIVFYTGEEAVFHFSQYWHTWLTGLIVWAFIFFMIKTKNEPFRQMGLSGIARFGLIVLLGLFLHGFLFYATGAEQAADTAMVVIGLHLLFGFYLLWIRPALEHLQKNLFEICSALVLLAAALMITEGILRVAGWTVLYFSEPDTLVYQDDPDDTRYRILCLGDSHTYGIGAPRGYSYPDQLEYFLHQHYGKDRASVINAGVPGSSSSDTRKEFERRWEQSWYHTVVVWSGINNAMTLRNAPRHLLAGEGNSRWMSFRYVVSEKLSDVRLYRLGVILATNTASLLRGDEAPEQQEDTSFWGIRTEVIRRTGDWLAQLERVELDERKSVYSEQQRLAFERLALPELLPSAHFEPLREWVLVPRSAAQWGGEEWCLHGWALIALNEGPATLPRYRSFQSFEKALERNPEDYWAWLGLARCLRDISQTPLAARLYEKLGEKNPEHPVAGVYAIRGKAILERVSLEQAAVEVIEQDPSVSLYKAFYVHELLQQKKFQQAENWLILEEGVPWGKTAEWAWAAARMVMLQGRKQYCVDKFKLYLERSGEKPIDDYVRLLELLAREQAMIVAAKVLPFKEIRAIGDPRLDRWMVELLMDVLEGEVAVDYGQSAWEKHEKNYPLFLFALGKAYVRRSLSGSRAREDDLSKALEVLRLACEEGMRLKRVYGTLYPVFPKKRLDILMHRWGEELEDPWREDLATEHLELEDVRVKVLLHDLEKIRQQAERDGASMLIINYPYDRRGHSTFDAAHRHFSKETGVPLVDIAAMFAGQLEERPREELFVPDGHPNARGYGLVAGEVFSELVHLDIFKDWARRYAGQPPAVETEAVLSATGVLDATLSAEVEIASPTDGISATGSIFVEDGET